MRCEANDEQPRSHALSSRTRADEHSPRSDRAEISYVGSPPPSAALPVPRLAMAPSFYVMTTQCGISYEWHVTRITVLREKES